MANIDGGKVVWNLDVDSKKLTEGLNSARDEVQRASKDIANTSKGIGTSLSNAFRNAEESSKTFAKGLGLVGAGLATFVGFTLKSAGEVEALRTSFDVLTGSVEEGGKVFKDLYDFANRTPFETPELAKATQTMLSFGISSKDVMTNLRILGDLSLGNKDKLAGLSLAFSQISSTGRLMGQDLLQMINAGFNPLTIISQKTGKSMIELKEAMADGAISADMVRDAMVTATSEGGLFFKGMEKGATTLQGVWSTLNDTLSTTARRLVGLSASGEVIKGGLLDKVKDGITGLTKFLTDNQEVIAKALEDSFGWIVKNGPIVVGIIIGGLTPAFYGLALAIGTVMFDLLPFIAIGAAVGIIIKLLIDAMGGWEEATKKVSAVLKTLGDVYNTWIKPSMDLLWKQLLVLGPPLKELWNLISPLLIPVLKILGAIILGTVVVAINLLIGVITGLVTGFNALIKVASFVYKAITDPIIEGWKTIKDYAERIKKAMNEINPFMRHSPSLVDNVIKGVDVIKSQFQSLGDMSINPVASMSHDFFYSSDSLSKGSTSPTTENKGGVIVNIAQANVSSQEDIAAIGREMGFRYNLVK